MADRAVHGAANNPNQRKHQRPRFVWMRDRKQINRWKDLFTGKGPDIFIENGRKADDGRPYRIPCYGWQHLEYDDGPWRRQKRSLFSMPHDAMHYDFKRRKYYPNPRNDAWSKLWMREDKPWLPDLARAATRGALIRFDIDGNQIPNDVDDPNWDQIIEDLFNRYATDFSDQLYDVREDIRNPQIRRRVNDMLRQDRRYPHNNDGNE